jgi:hypothetical protein
VVIVAKGYSVNDEDLHIMMSWLHFNIVILIVGCLDVDGIFGCLEFSVWLNTNVHVDYSYEF